MEFAFSFSLLRRQFYYNWQWKNLWWILFLASRFDEVWFVKLKAFTKNDSERFCGGVSEAVYF